MVLAAVLVVLVAFLLVVSLVVAVLAVVLVVLAVAAAAAVLVVVVPRVSSAAPSLAVGGLGRVAFVLRASAPLFTPAAGLLEVARLSPLPPRLRCPSPVPCST